MANFEKALVEELKTVVSDVYPLVAPEGTYAPYVVYVSSYGDRDRALEGYRDGREIEVSIHVIGGSYADMKMYTNQIVDKLLLLEGLTMGQDLIPVQSVKFEHCEENVDLVTKENHCFVEMKFRI